MSKTLKFWTECEYDRRTDERDDCIKSQLLSEILRQFEEAGYAMRYLNSKGQVAWKAKPRMLTRLADAEQEARDDAEHHMFGCLGRLGSKSLLKLLFSGSTPMPSPLLPASLSKSAQNDAIPYSWEALQQIFLAFVSLGKTPQASDA
jgi:hypothetical protein